MKGGLFALHNRKIWELAELVLYAQPITEQKAVIALKRYVIGLDVDAPLPRFIYEHTGFQRFHPALGQMTRDIIERYAGRNDTAYQQYIAASRVELARKHYLGLPAVAVTSRLHKAAAYLNIKRAKQIGEKDKSVVEYSDYCQVGGGARAYIAHQLLYAIFSIGLRTNYSKSLFHYSPLGD